MSVHLLLGTGVALLWGATLLIDTWQRRCERHRGTLVDRLAPYQGEAISEQARWWLDHRD